MRDLGVQTWYGRGLATYAVTADEWRAHQAWRHRGPGLRPDLVRPGRPSAPTPAAAARAAPAAAVRWRSRCWRSRRGPLKIAIGVKVDDLIVFDDPGQRGANSAWEQSEAYVAAARSGM